ncbi:hypothetical protein V6N12_042614 [Hibiscus sabdariffa]|uniref:Uncharacterized protein n=1 Tax=Hibiscus sabdariffa TaxID=183260 RepID=A0ABR2EFN8_9ROSI
MKNNFISEQPDGPKNGKRNDRKSLFMFGIPKSAPGFEKQFRPPFSEEMTAGSGVAERVQTVAEKVPHLGSFSEDDPKSGVWIVFQEIP